MTGIDLRELLDEQSAETSDRIMHHLRLVGVRRKVVRRRRQRLATVVTAAVAVLAAAAAATVPPPARDATRLGAASRPGLIEGFPEYDDGARVVAAAMVHLPLRTVSLSLTPSTDDLVLFRRCKVESEGEFPILLTVELKINNKPLLSGGCNGSSRSGPGGLADLGVRAGAPTTVSMTVLSARVQAGEKAVPTEVPGKGEVALAVGERIPFGKYPLPRRPETLASLQEQLSFAREEKVTILQADPADPSRPVVREVRWQTVTTIQAFSQTPGFLHIRVNGVEVGTHESWDYEVAQSGTFGDQEDGWAKEYGLRLRPGDPVTVRVDPEHVTGDWAVVLELA